MKYIKLFRVEQRYCLFLISAFMLVRCTPTTSSTSSDNVTATITNEQSGLATEAIQEVASQSSTATNTPTPITTPILPVPTISSAPSPTIISQTSIPIPTLTSEQKADNFTRLMTENEGCELPCWWGIIPGESKIELIADQFVPQGLVWWEEWNQLDFENPSSGAIVIFTEEEGVIQSIKAGGRGEGSTFVQDWERYSLDQVLTHYGVPSLVFVYYPYKADPGPSTYQLYLFYEALGIEIDYAGMAEDFQDKEETQVCPNLQDVFRINLFLYQPSQINNIVETVIPPETVGFIASPKTVYDLIGWEQATNTTLQSFYETFSQPNSENCFEFQRYWTSNGE